jgi:hypothetical protein
MSILTDRGLYRITEKTITESIEVYIYRIRLYHQN